MNARKVTAYKCSSCNLVHTQESRIRLHVGRSKKCADGSVVPCVAMVPLDDPTDERTCTSYQAHASGVSFTVWVCSRCHYASTLRSSVNRHVTSSTPCRRTTTTNDDVDALMSMRTPSGIHEDSATGCLDARIDHLCSSAHVLAACFDLRAPSVHEFRFIDISLKLLDHLWGPLAPTCFRTIWCTRLHHVHDLRAVDVPGDPGTVLIDAYKNAEELREFVIGVYVALLEVADGVEARCPEYAQAALKYRNVLRGHQLTTLDVLERNETYDKLRRVETNRVKLANRFKTAMHAYLRKLRFS